MKHTIVLLFTLGCSSGIPQIDTPGVCGFWEASDVMIADDGECLWVMMQDDSAVTDGECPNDRQRCIVVSGNQEAIAWTSPGGRGIGLRVAYPLGPDQSCPVSCEWNGVCGRSDLLPGECVPCPRDFTPRDSDPFTCEAP